MKLLFLSIRILCIILNLKKQKYWKKEQKGFATRKKNWNFCRQMYSIMTMLQMVWNTSDKPDIFAVPSTSLASCNAVETSGKRRKTFTKRRRVLLGWGEHIL
jgi:hypothetical protein